MTSSLLPTYARADLAFEHGEGVWLTATDGVRYLDFGGGIAVASLGYGHPHLLAALREQGEKLWHTSNLFKIPQAEALAERLAAASFADFVFFTNSGAEALEGAIKTARKYQSACGRPEKFRIVAFKGAFHGRTMATLSAGGNPKYLEGFGPPLEGFDHAEFGDLASVEALIGPQTGAILVEPIQGEAGVRVGAPEFLRGLRALCDRHGLLLVLDEVQTGVGRTGRLFAHEFSGATPDIMAVAKGIGGGFPLGAFLTTREAGKGMVVGSHGTTYGGNPLGTAVGGAVLDVVLAPGFLDHVAKAGARLKQGLLALKDEHPGVVAGVRGEGLMLGVELRPPVGEFVAAARAQKLIVIPAGDNVARILPPLVIDDAEIDEGLRRLSAACAVFDAPALSEAAG
ncbi:aspartate aminotransferase family protein [Methylocella sp.]|uniref:aspartate aminotransferase family protein n=1 Tax=Methylocella sp. TaxID=1978226 RepID=UPI003783BCEA